MNGAPKLTLICCEFSHVPSGNDTENLAITLATQIANLPHPRVHIVVGGPDIIREGGFLYVKNSAGYDKYMDEKRLAKEAAKAGQK